MRELVRNLNKIKTEKRCEELDSMQKEALKSLRESTASMKSKIEQATDRIQPVFANASR